MPPHPFLWIAARLALFLWWLIGVPILWLVMCTLRRGHRGRHEAHGSKDEIVAHWHNDNG